jgi:hypothetical protein
LSPLCILKEITSWQTLDQEAMMVIKGINVIRGIRGIRTMPGPISESSIILELYQLSTEKEHLMKKIQWIRLQEEQAEKRFSQIERTIHIVEKKTARKSMPHADFHSRFIEY